MRKQYAVFGLGRFGESVALALESLHCDVIVVDNNAEKIHEIADQVSYALHADIEDPEVMNALGARNLDGAIVAISDNLEASILATILSKENGVPYVLAKAKSRLHGSILKKVGADSLIYPEREMGSRIARSLVATRFVDWIDLSPYYSMLEIGVPDEWVGKCLRELNPREKYDVNVVGAIEAEEVDVNIDPEKPLTAEMILILIGNTESLNKIVKR